MKSMTPTDWGHFWGRGGRVGRQTLTESKFFFKILNPFFQLMSKKLSPLQHPLGLPLGAVVVS